CCGGRERKIVGILKRPSARAGVPVHLARGAVRPDPAGRALCVLLHCAADGLSAQRLGTLPGGSGGDWRSAAMAPPHAFAAISCASVGGGTGRSASRGRGGRPNLGRW